MPKFDNKKDLLIYMTNIYEPSGFPYSNIYDVFYENKKMIDDIIESYHPEHFNIKIPDLMKILYSELTKINRDEKINILI